MKTQDVSFSRHFQVWKIAGQISRLSQEFKTLCEPWKKILIDPFMDNFQLLTGTKINSDNLWTRLKRMPYKKKKKDDKFKCDLFKTHLLCKVIKFYRHLCGGDPTIQMSVKFCCFVEQCLCLLLSHGRVY